MRRADRSASSESRASRKRRIAGTQRAAFWSGFIERLIAPAAKKWDQQ
jgi:hypothetical protein